MSIKRKTIQNKISYSGIGLHKGEKIDMTLYPLESGNGIQFKRVDVNGDNIIEVKLENVFNPTRGTNIKNKNGAEMHTIEHFLSGLYIYGITDLMIEINGNELPIGDGSAYPFIEILDKAGIKEYEEDADIMEIKEPVYISEGDKHLVALPYSGYKITYAVNYNHTFLKSQLVEFEITKENFKDKISNCRTFGFDYEIEYLKANKLALGGSLDNAIVISKDGVLNEGGLRYEDEFVRHKVLDLIGDLKILNKIIKGHIIAVKSGHALDIKFAEKLNSIGGDNK